MEGIATLPDWQSSRRKLFHSIAEPLWGSPNSDPMSTNTPEIPMEKHVQALMAVWMLAIFLREVTNLTRLPLINPRLLRTLQVPSTRHIPCLSMMDLPLPFCADATKLFTKCHLPKITSEAFFSDGEEWVGYYSYGTEESMRWDPQMHDIRFEVDRKDDSSEYINLHATGKDYVGTFNLDGLIWRQTGKAAFTKCYHWRHSWYWNCIITPFGIVGTWGGGHLMGGRVGGWLWLWKASWSDSGHLDG